MDRSILGTSSRNILQHVAVEIAGNQTRKARLLHQVMSRGDTMGAFLIRKGRERKN